MLGSDRVVGAVLFQRRRVGQRTAGIHVVLKQIPECTNFLRSLFGSEQCADLDPDIAVAMHQEQHIERGALAIRAGMDIGIEFIEWCGDFTDHTGLFEGLVVIQRDETCSAIQVPEWAFGRAEPKCREEFRNYIS
ncbi:hypothetical protein AO742_01505 [Pseudomonas citronellolis]|nr:hypothetical protein AO742_01505 [Pseudomonas citronellolis]